LPNDERRIDKSSFDQTTPNGPRSAIRSFPEFDDLDSDLRGPGIDHADVLRRALREVDDTAPDERPAVVDLDDDAAAVAHVRHLDARFERQRPVGRRTPARIVFFAAGRLAPAELGRVKAGLAVLDAHMTPLRRTAGGDEG